MIEQTVEYKVYITDDGHKFMSRQLAEEYEATLALQEQLQHFQIRGPHHPPYLNDELVKYDLGYEWYWAANAGDLSALLRLLKQVYHANIHYTPKGDTFPVILAYNPTSKKMVDYERLKCLHDTYEAEWQQMQAMLGKGGAL